MSGQVDGVDFDPNEQLQMIAVIEFGLWTCRLSMEQAVTVGRGWVHWIDQALGRIYDSLPLNAREVPRIILQDASGNTLLCEDDDQRQEEWLRDMVVSATLRPAAFDVYEEREQARAG